MAWTEVERGKLWKPQRQGEALEGIYNGSHEAKFGKAYDIQDSNGELWTVFGSAVLDSRMANISLGSRVKIIYEGKKPSKKAGRQDFNDFKVQVWKD
jgi:hypothetical protein